MCRFFIVSLIILISTKAEAQQTSALTIADSLYAVGNYSEAIAAYQKIESPKEGVFLKIARAYRAKGNYDAALDFFAKAAQEKNATIAKNEYGTLLITAGKFKKADSLYSELIEKHAENPNFYYQRGRARMQAHTSRLHSKTDSMVTKSSGREDRYIRDFEKAVALDSTHQKALYETAKFYLKQKAFKRVEKLASKALETYPDNVAIISLLAQENYMRGFCTDAIKWFSKLLELNRESRFIHEHLGMCYYKNRYYKLAIAQYLSVLDYDAKDWYTHENLAKLYNLTGDYKNAEKHGKLALEFKDLPLDNNYYTLANTYKLSENWKDAMLYLNKALSENPDLKKARYAKAVVADNYYEDQDAVLKLYEDFITRYSAEDGKFEDPRVKLAEDRVKMIKRERFMAKKN